MGYRGTKVLALPALWTFGRRPRVVGLPHVPRTGGAILASNHLSILDSAYLPAYVPRPLVFVAKKEYFSGDRVIDRATGVFLRGAGQLSVDRSSGRAAQQALDASLQVLRDGELFGIYPEGTRSPDGRLYRGRTGVGWLALSSGLPVVPVAMAGTDRMLPPGRTVPRPARVTITFGEPLAFPELAGQAGSARARRTVTDAVMQAIAALSGQEVVPSYAPTRGSGRPPASPDGSA